MLVIRSDLVDAMVAHARADHPDEACGIIAGPDGSDRAERFIRMLNAERSPTFYRFDSGEQLKVWRAMDDANETVDMKRRIADYMIVQREFAKDDPSVILWFRKDLEVYTSALKDFTPTPVITTPFWNTWRYHF